MERVAPRVARWTERTISGEDRDGYLIGNDTIPETLEPLFRRHSAEHLPVLAAVNTLFDQWSATASSGDELPRSFGRVPFIAGGSEGQTLALSSPCSGYRLHLMHWKVYQTATAQMPKVS